MDRSVRGSSAKESKYFVDMKLKYSEQSTLEAFEILSDKDKNDRNFMSNWLRYVFKMMLGANPLIGSFSKSDDLIGVERNQGSNYLKTFLSNYFDPPGSEFQNHQFDQVENPKMIEKIQNEDYRQWALELHKIWQQERV